LLHLVRRLLRRPKLRIDAPGALDPLIDDSARRLVRAPESPRRLGSSVDAPHGRDPPRRWS
jgi:hypothetical protein